MNELSAQQMLMKIGILVMEVDFLREELRKLSEDEAVNQKEKEANAKTNGKNNGGFSPTVVKNG